MMSDAEEPPSKMTRIDTDPEALDDFEGQEEWLSEELLTDDEVMTEEQDHISHNDSTMEDLRETIPEAVNKDPQNNSQEDIEQALNSLDNSNSQELDAFLIRKTDGRVVESKKLNVDLDDSGKKNAIVESSQDEDGNSTDDLLRMLGEDNDKDKKKKIVKKAPQRPKQDESTDDEEIDDAYEGKGSRITRLRLAQNALIKKQPAKKAEPEDMSDSSTTSDEVDTMKKIFVSKAKKSTVNNQNNKASPKNQPTKVTPKPQTVKVTPKSQPVKMTPKSQPVKVTPKSQPTRVTPKYNKATPKGDENNFKIKTSVNYRSQSNNLTPKNQTKGSPKKQFINPPKRIGNVTITPTSNIESKNSKFNKNMFNFKPDKITPLKTDIKVNMSKKKELKITKAEPKVKKTEIKMVKPSLSQSKSSLNSSKSRPKLGLDELDEIIDEEEFLEDDDDFGLSELMEDTDDEEITKEIRPKQRIMKPEVMDEEMPSDIESASEDGSIYDSSGVESAYADGSMHDEMPSSDYDDELEEWFTLDIRSERAGEYIPLLGPKAYQLLSDEKRRVTSRLESLKKSLSDHRDSTRRQKEQLKSATATLAELDAMLVAL